MLINNPRGIILISPSYLDYLHSTKKSFSSITAKLEDPVLVLVFQLFEKKKKKKVPQNTTMAMTKSYLNFLLKFVEHTISF